ncbi:MAG TPA: S1 family peptidase, partial [Glaciihabitans sp.]|nr:S1 family peptidase [Glaciihabitans sp.]
SEQAVFLDRQNDYAPWNGGDFITNGRGDCTSGIPVHNPGGARYLVTAGHCFAVGEVIRNKSVRIPLGTNNIIGPVAVRDFLTPYSLDAELINTNSSPYTWRGGTAGQSPTTKSFAGALTSPIGAPVCHSGAFEGDRCFTIQQNGITKQIEGYWLSSLVRATGSDPQAVGQGDSGGPVVRMIGNSMYGVGTVTAGEGVWTTCSNWSPQTSRKCYPTLLYTDLGPTLTKWGISVN